MRQTKTREEVLRFLNRKHQAYTPYEIADHLAMNPVTVYRVLEFLKGQKSVHHIPSLGKWSACRCLGAEDDHGFLICRKCEKVEEFLSPHQCIHHYGFQCDEHITEALGLCGHCSKK